MIINHVFAYTLISQKVNCLELKDLLQTNIKVAIAVSLSYI